jgi:hypothetical protein
MPKTALVVSIASIAMGACALCSMIVPGGFVASAETERYPSANAQIFDATPIGGELHTLASAARRSQAAANPTVKAQIFDPEVFSSVRSNFSGTRSIAANSDASQATIEGRSVGTTTPSASAPARLKELSPKPSRECEPRPSAGTNEPQFGSLEGNQAA